MSNCPSWHNALAKKIVCLREAINKESLLFESSHLSGFISALLWTDAVDAKEYDSLLKLKDNAFLYRRKELGL